MILLEELNFWLAAEMRNKKVPGNARVKVVGLSDLTNLNVEDLRLTYVDKLNVVFIHPKPEADE